MSTDSWQIEFKRADTEWTSDEYAEVRNVVGSAAVSVSSDTFSDIAPGVLRHTITAVDAGVATITVSAGTVDDLRHPLLDSVDVTLGTGGTYYAVLSETSAVDDVFDLGIGYYWDDDESEWKPTRSFGVVPPGYVGPSVFLRLTNISSRHSVQTAIVWNNTGDDFLWVRQSDGTWSAPGDGVLFIADSDAITGFVKSGESVEIEIRPTVPSDATSANNMVVGTIGVSNSWA
jgi:hypothetical protein